MADRSRNDPDANPPQTFDTEPAGANTEVRPPEVAVGQESRSQPARPDPKTGEVPAGPGDAGLASRPEVNAGSPGTEQMSYRRLGIGLGIAALLSILAFIFAAVF